MTVKQFERQIERFSRKAEKAERHLRQLMEKADILISELHGIVGEAAEVFESGSGTEGE